mgnify:FL=1
MLVNEGKILTALQHRRLHETKGYGSTYRETAPLDDRLLAACGRLMAALKYTGVAMVEFRVDPETNDWSLIEVNGRFWGSLPLAAAAGIDFPLHLFELLVVGQTKFSQDYRTGVRSRALTNDLRWMWRRMTKGQTACPINDANQQGWAINQVPLRHVAQAIVRGMTFRDHVDTFSSSDIWPAISELRQLGIAVQVSLRSRMPMLWGRLLGCTFHRNRHHDRRGAVGAFD